MPANLAIYLPAPPPAAESIRGHAAVESADIDESTDGVPTQYRVVVNGVGIQINPMDGPRVRSHIEGFTRFVQQVPATLHTGDVKRRLQSVKTILGCVIQPDVDAEGKVDDFLFELAAEGDGLVFMSDSVFSADGQGLIGRCSNMHRKAARGK